MRLSALAGYTPGVIGDAGVRILRNTRVIWNAGMRLCATAGQEFHLALKTGIKYRPKV